MGTHCRWAPRWEHPRSPSTAGYCVDRLLRLPRAPFCSLPVCFPASPGRCHLPRSRGGIFFRSSFALSKHPAPASFQAARDHPCSCPPHRSRSERCLPRSCSPARNTPSVGSSRAGAGAHPSPSRSTGSSRLGCRGGGRMERSEGARMALRSGSSGAAKCDAAAEMGSLPFACPRPEPAVVRVNG